MIEAHLGLNKGDLESARLALQQASEMGTTPKSRAEIENLGARTEAARRAGAFDEEKLRQLRDFASLEKSKLAEEVRTARLRGDAAGEAAATDKLKRVQAAELFPLEMDKLREETLYRRKATADIGKAREEDIRRYQRQNLPFKFPSKESPTGYEEGDVPTTEIYKDVVGRGKGALTDEQWFRRQDTLARREIEAEKSEEKRKETSEEAEAIILGRNNKGVPNVRNPAVEVSMSVHNRTSDNPYFYTLTPPSWVPPAYASANKIPLEDVNGKPLKARQVYKGWRDYQQKKGTISLEDYVKLVIREGK